MYYTTFALSWHYKNHLYYIEWVYQRSWLCHKCDVARGGGECICKLGYECDVNLLLNPYIVELGLPPHCGVSDDIHEDPLHAMYTGASLLLLLNMNTNLL